MTLDSIIFTGTACSCYRSTNLRWNLRIMDTLGTQPFKNTGNLRIMDTLGTQPFKNTGNLRIMDTLGTQPFKNTGNLRIMDTLGTQPFVLCREVVLLLYRLSVYTRVLLDYPFTMKNRRYPSLKSVGNLVKKFIEHARARHVSVFPIQNLIEICRALVYLTKKNTAFPSSFSWKHKGNL